MDVNGLSLTEKAMIVTGLPWSPGSSRIESQVTDQLQAIMCKHQNHFNGEPVVAESVKTESDSDCTK